MELELIPETIGLSPLSLDSPAWASILSVGLGAKVEIVAAEGRPVLLALLSAGPFRVLYPDFPVGAEGYSLAQCQAIVRHGRAMGADLVRFHSRTRLPLPCREVARQNSPLVADLASWMAYPPKRARHARNRDSRSELQIESGVEEDSDDLYRLYIQTVARHHGNARYGRRYFREISRPATLVARLDGKLCGFVAYARLGDRGYYLHAAHDPATREHQSSDQLVLAMLSRGADAGLRSFDFLPSPAGQPGLERYKATWGGEPRDFIVSDIPLNPVRAGLFKAAKWVVDNAQRPSSRRARG